jgi:hypothetical protein
MKAFPVSMIRRQLALERQMVVSTRSFSTFVAVDDRDAAATVSSVDRITAVLLSAETDAEVPNVSQWKNLVKPRKLEKAGHNYANEDNVYTGILLVADHCEIADLYLPTQTSNLVIHSWATSPAITKYRREKEPENGFVAPSAPAKLSLHALRQALDERGAETLADVPGLNVTSFVINFEEHHWALLVYDKSENVLTSYDSLADYAQNDAICLARLLLSMRLVPTDTRTFKLRMPVRQQGAWECGWATIVMATHAAGALGGESPAPIIQNPKLLRQFVARMAFLSEQNRSAEKFIDRLHWYKYE